MDAKSENLPQPELPKSNDRSRWWRGFVVAILMCGVAIGAGWQPGLSRFLMSLVSSSNAQHQVLHWRSPHDPNIQSDHPGKDEMGMELIPVYADEVSPPKAVSIDPVLVERTYDTVVLSEGPFVQTIRAFSTIDYSEPQINDVTLKVDAWLQKLGVDFEGQTVQRGDLLYEVYAPDLVSTQENFLTSLRFVEAMKQKSNPRLVSDAEKNLDDVRLRLRFWDMTDEQIDELSKSRSVQKSIRFYSPYDGVVIKKQAFEGKFAHAGELLYRIANLSKVWAFVHIYPAQTRCVIVGQSAELVLTNLPGHKFPGKVIYIYPFLEQKSLTLRVLIEFENPNLLLKPALYGEVTLAPHKTGQGLSIPRSAVLQTGTRQLCYLVRSADKFEPREIHTGMELDGDRLEVVSGLQKGDRVVDGCEFLMDSESRVRSVNRRFQELPQTTDAAAGHEHQMPGMSMPNGMPGMSMPDKMPEMSMPNKKDTPKKMDMPQKMDMPMMKSQHHGPSTP
jgi:Cu(I)/Ag(I) efflux system membrane fusion protein